MTSQTFLKNGNPQRHPVSTVAALAAVLVFVTMLGGVVSHAIWLKQFDDAIRQTVFSWQPQWWTRFVKVGTQLFNSRQVMLILLVCVLGLGFTASYRDATFITATTITGVLLNTICKMLVRRPRPTDHVLMHYGSWSFPSGHSIAAMIICGCLIVIVWRHLPAGSGRAILTCLLAIVILFIGYSRVYVSAHYPSDVLGGWALGYLVLLVSWHWFYGSMPNQVRQRVHATKKPPVGHRRLHQ